MAQGELITEDYQLEYRSVLFGEGTNREVVSFDPFTLPDLRTGDTDRPLDHGQFRGRDYLSGKAFPLSLEVWGNTEAELQEAYADVLRVTNPTPFSSDPTAEEAIYFSVPSWDTVLRLNVRPRRRVGPIITQEFNMLVGRMELEFWATDPRTYEMDPRIDTAEVSGDSNGLEFPATFNLTFGGIGTSNSLSLDNVGNFETRPLITLGATGSGLTNPAITITNNQGTKTLQLNTTLAAGDFIYLDYQNRTVLYSVSGSSLLVSRYVWVDDPDGWHTLEPGLNTVVLTGQGTGSADLTWSPAWV